MWATLTSTIVFSNYQWQKWNGACRLPVLTVEWHVQSTVGCLVKEYDAPHEIRSENLIPLVTKLPIPDVTVEMVCAIYQWLELKYVRPLSAETV